LFVEIIVVEVLLRLQSPGKPGLYFWQTALVV